MAKVWSDEERLSYLLKRILDGNHDRECKLEAIIKARNDTIAKQVVQLASLRAVIENDEYELVSNLAKTIASLQKQVDDLTHAANKTVMQREYRHAGHGHELQYPHDGPSNADASEGK